MEVALILTCLAGLGLAFSMAWTQERRCRRAYVRCLSRRSCPEPRASAR
ncbi:MAG: hypothetical protein V1806_15975 [Pseudomonadota bacterium]